MTAGCAVIAPLRRAVAPQSNRITEIAHLDQCVQLEELFLSHNGITRITGLERLTKLRTLDLACNMIEHLENVAHLTELEDFWFNGNRLTRWPEIEQLRHAARLDTVYFEGNPIADDVQYRTKLRLALPSLRQIDASLVR